MHGEVCSEDGCENTTDDVEEYCHHCGDIVCFEHLEDEWCNECNWDLFVDPIDGNAVHL